MINTKLNKYFTINNFLIIPITMLIITNCFIILKTNNLYYNNYLINQENIHYAEFIIHQHEDEFNSIDNSTESVIYSDDKIQIKQLGIEKNHINRLSDSASILVVYPMKNDYIDKYSTSNFSRFINNNSSILSRYEYDKKNSYDLSRQNNYTEQEISYFLCFIAIALLIYLFMEILFIRNSHAKSDLEKLANDNSPFFFIVVLASAFLMLFNSMYSFFYIQSIREMNLFSLVVIISYIGIVYKGITATK